MTLVIAVASRESIWVCADRRLSARARAPKDDAVKVLASETPDGVFLLGYAGLGQTIAGTEPSDWFSNVLRGRSLSVEESMQALAGAMRDELPVHLAGFPKAPGVRHDVVCPAFLNGKPKVYTMGVELSIDPPGHWLALNRQEMAFAGKPPPPVALAGSGALLLQRDIAGARALLHLVSAHNRGRISARAVADRLASMNLAVHASEKSVGPDSVVMWRYRKEGKFEGGGGAQYYQGAARVRGRRSPPDLAPHGRDMRAFLEKLMPHIRFDRGPTADEVKEMEGELNALPTHPDPKLK